MNSNITVSFFVAALAAGTSHAATVANWKALFALAPLTPATVTTSGLNTSSPVFGGPDLGMDGVGIAGRFGTTAVPESVTLAVGETLTVSATVTLTGGADNLLGHYRFSVQNDGGQFAAESSENWAGGWMHTVGTTGSLFQTSTGVAAGNNYMSTVTTSPNNAVNLTPTAVRSGTFSGDSATPYTWTMSITRDSATTVDIFSFFSGGGGSFSESYTEEDVTTTFFTYTSIGIQTTGQTNLDRLGLSNVQFTVIPEPSAALLGGLGLLSLLRRRR